MTNLETETNFQDYIRTVEDFPKPGIRFYDIAPLLGNGAILGSLIKEMARPLAGKINKILGYDARGFLFAGAMAVELEIGCAMLRKAGKLPGETRQQAYDLEYGSAAIEIQADAVRPGDRVALVDDVIATGGTGLAGIELVKNCGGNIVQFCTVIDLPVLGGSQKIEDRGVEVSSVMELGV